MTPIDIICVLQTIYQNTDLEGSVINYFLCVIIRETDITMAQVVIEKVKYIPLLTAGCMTLAVTLPYIVAICRQRMLMFLPYISHVAAFPPQSALLSIFMAIAAIFAVPTFLLRYVAVEHKRSRLETKKVQFLNKAAVVIGYLAIAALLLSSHYPIGYITHLKKDWIQTVVVPHFAALTIVLTLFSVYVLIEAYLTYVQRRRSTKNVFVHATAAMCVVITTWTTCLPFYAAVRNLEPQIINEDTEEINLETREYNFFYIISSLSEWGFTFLSILFIATFYRDFKRMKITLRLIPKTVNVDTVQQPPHDVYNGRDESTKM